MKRWHEKLVLAERRAVKDELDRIEASSGRAVRLRRIMSQVGALEGDDSAIGRLRRYVYSMSALVHHERHGGLSEHQIDGLVDIAHAILQVQGIKPLESNLSFLFADVHLVVSQIQRQRGEHWRAAWELTLAHQLNRRMQSSGESFQILSLGIRALRLGHGILAARHFADAANASDLAPNLKRRAALYHIKTLRLCRLIDEAKAASDELEKEPLTEVEKREIEWESICRDSAQTMDLSPMMNAVKRGQNHCNASYFSEAFLWAAASQRTAQFESLPSLRTMTEAKVLKPREMGLLFKCLKQIEVCYDTGYPLMARIRGMGATLGQLTQLVSIDLELLVWLAGTRWLARSNTFTLAALSLKEYGARSMCLTEGQSDDSLGIAADLRSRRWAETVEPPDVGVKEAS